MSTRTASARIRGLARVFGAVATSALCVSFAWSIVGGALRPITQTPPPSITLATAERAVTQPPLVPPKPARHTASTRIVVAEPKSSAQRLLTAEKDAAPAAASDGYTETSASAASADRSDQLLLASSKSSRTRGQPLQD